jgi:hypothetical protein
MKYHNNGRNCSICGIHLPIRASVCDPCKDLNSKINELWIIRGEANASDNDLQGEESVSGSASTGSNPECDGVADRAYN